MNNDERKQILAIQVQLGMMIMSLLTEADVGVKAEKMTVHLVSSMQTNACKLLGLGVEEIQEVWSKVQCGLNDIKRTLTPEQAREVAQILSDDLEGQA